MRFQEFFYFFVLDICCKSIASNKNFSYEEEKSTEYKLSLIHRSCEVHDADCRTEKWCSLPGQK
jgi:hypothetical protein